MDLDGARISINLLTGGVLAFDPADALVVRTVDGRSHLYISGAPQYFVVEGSLQDVAEKVGYLWFEADDVFLNPRWISAVVTRADNKIQLFFPGLSFTVVLPGMKEPFAEGLARAVATRKELGKPY
jgi:hypothetical protein